MTAGLLSLLALVAMGLCQITVFSLFFVAPRQVTRRFVGAALAYAVVYGMVNEACAVWGLSTNGWYYILVQFALVWAFVRLSLDLDVSQSCYYALVAVLCTTFVDYAYGNGLLFLCGEIPYAEGGTPLMRALSFAGLCVIESVILLFLRCATHATEHPPTVRRILMLVGAGVVLYAFSSITVMLINVTGDAAREYLAQLDTHAHFAGLHAQTAVQVLCAVASLVTVVGMELAFSSYEYEQELIKTRHLMQMQNQYYKLKKEMIEQVDCQYHDLKNHVDALKGLTNETERQGYIASLERRLSEYEMLNHTGNTALDIVLSNKQRQCARHNVRLLFMADGSLFEHVDPVDVVSIFGNVLDNAIEATANVADVDRRIITLKTNANNSWVSLRVQNPYDHELREGGEGLLTTKADERMHGVGLKSVDYAAKKYGGFFSYECTEGTFTITVALRRS